ncbi:MAG: ATP-binding protein [Acidobacteriota bacterium]
MAAAAAAQPVSMTAAGVRTALVAGAAAPATVRVRAVVTFADETQPIYFVQDETGGIAVVPRSPSPAVRPGQRVVVTGRMELGPRGPTLVDAEVEVAGAGARPAPRPVSAAALEQGAADGVLVAVQGRTRRASVEGSLTTLTLAAGTASIRVFAGSGAPREAAAAEALVEVVGIPVPRVRDGIVVGRELLVAQPDDVRVVAAAPDDPYAAPRITIAELGRARQQYAGRRVRLRGTVTRQRPGRSLYLRDESGNAYVETALETPVVPGDVVEAIGFADVDEFAPYLADAEYRKVADGPPPEPIDATPAELASGRLDAALVRTEAVLIGVERGRDELTFVLQHPSLTFNAHVLIPRSEGLIDDLPLGSHLRVTGICSVVVDTDRVPRSFRLQLRDAADVEVVSRPSSSAAFGAGWAAWAGVSLAAIALGALGLVYRRSVAQERTIRRQFAREAALKARFDDIFERSSDLILVHDRRGRIATVNRAAEQASGYTREELRPLDPEWIVSSTYLHEVRHLIEQGPEAPPRSFRAELITRRSQKVPIEVHARVVASDGQVTGVTAVARNLSERDQLDAQLRQAQKMEAVGRLATGIAHDFNNLITVLLSYSDELIEKIPPESDLYHPAQEIQQAAERASALTEQLLSFSRRQIVVPQTVDLNAAVANMHDLLKRLLGADITLDVNLEPGLGLVRVDQAQVGQVMMNLAVNARDAMPHGGTLTIETANVEMGEDAIDAIPGPHVLLRVSDTGVGMPPEVRRRLFEPFFTTKEAGRGTGLGMSMVQAIVRQSGGHITVESEPGHGTTFRLYFPRIMQEDEAGPEAAPLPQGPLPEASGVVLIAEDDAAVRRLAVRELTRRGYDVLQASDGVEALDLVRGHAGRLDLLIADVVMPRLNGPDLASAVETLRPGLPVLYITGHPERAGQGLTAAEMESGRVLLKPFTGSTLVDRVDAVLAAARRTG